MQATTAPQVLCCHINVDGQTLAACYRGEIRFIQAQAEDGRQVRIAFQRLRPLITHSGLQGRFEFVLGNDAQLLSVRKIS